MVLPQHVHAVVGGQKQVSGVPEPEVRGLAVHLNVFVELGNELGSEHRQANIDRLGELVTDAGLRQSGGGPLVGGVHLDDQNGPVVVRILR